jgi:hypothetical protein
LTGPALTLLFVFMAVLNSRSVGAVSLSKRIRCIQEVGLQSVAGWSRLKRQHRISALRRNADTKPPNERSSDQGTGSALTLTNMRARFSHCSPLSQSPRLQRPWVSPSRTPPTSARADAARIRGIGKHWQDWFISHQCHAGSTPWSFSLK